MVRLFSEEEPSTSDNSMIKATSSVAAPNVATLVNALREKDARISQLEANQKSIDLDVHNLTEQLFQQAYKLVNDEKKRSAELKVRIEMLEAENAALKSTVKAHKRPTFSHRILSPSSLMTPVKLSKTPFRTLLNRYSNLATSKRVEQVKLMEPLFSEEEPSSSDKSMTDVSPPVVQQPTLSPDVASLISEVNESNLTDVEQLRTNQTKLVNALRDQSLCNQNLRSYVDNILSRVLETYPEILEINQS